MATKSVHNLPPSSHAFTSSRPLVDHVVVLLLRVTILAEPEKRHALKLDLLQGSIELLLGMCMTARHLAIVY
jgi:hypothetical protein